MILSRCTKTVFVGQRKLKSAIARAVGSFNAGASHLTEVMGLLAIEANEVTQAYIEEGDSLRVTNAGLH